MRRLVAVPATWAGLWFATAACVHEAAATSCDYVASRLLDYAGSPRR